MPRAQAEINGSGTLTAPRRPRLAKELVDSLTEQIRSGEWKPGERLPGELQIMQHHRVSRTVVREAISALQAAGYVHTRHGIGTFVLETPAKLEFQFRVDATSIPTVLDILAMLELRKGLESEAAAIAAVRRTDAQLAEMRRVLTAFHSAMESGGETAQPDFQFHLLIAEATGNRYFVEVLAHFGTTTIPRTRVSLRQSAVDQKAYLAVLAREHEHIFSAILRGDPGAAAACMRTHLANSLDRFRKAQDAER